MQLEYRLNYFFLYLQVLAEIYFGFQFEYLLELNPELLKFDGN
jgi:hypothetical protein